MIISDLRTDYKLPVMGITTSANLKSASKRGNILDKNKTVPYVVKYIEDGVIEYPRILTKGLHKMKKELDNYGVTQGGKYQAMSGHDDSISCLVILVHWAKRTMLRSNKRQLFGIGSKDPYDGKSNVQKSREHVLKRFENSSINTDNIHVNFH